MRKFYGFTDWWMPRKRSGVLAIFSEEFSPVGSFGAAI
jgi:hypothetical protein